MIRRVRGMHLKTLDLTWSHFHIQSGSVVRSNSHCSAQRVDDMNLLARSWIAPSPSRESYRRTDLPPTATGPTI